MSGGSSQPYFAVIAVEALSVGTFTVGSQGTAATLDGNNATVLADGGLANVKNATKPNVYIAFQVEGDAESRRVILYNCSLGDITREYNTIEESKEPTTETLPITCTGDNTTGATMAVYKPEDSGYATLFTNPSAPAI